MTTRDYTSLGKKLRQDINRKFGFRCKQYDFGCVVCNAHRVVDGVDSLSDLLEALDKDKPIHRHRRVKK